MKDLKKKILSVLVEDARTSADKIAVMLGADKKTVSSLITEMEQDGTIVKYTALTDGLLNEDRVEALIEVKVSPSKSKGFDEIAGEIYKLDEVKSLYLMSGGYDLTVVVEGRSLREVALFVSEKLSCLDKVLSTATHFILKKYKTEGVLTVRAEKDKRIAAHV